MANRYIILVALVAASVCIGHVAGATEPTLDMNDAKDKVLMAANAAVAKSHFPAGRSLLQRKNNLDRNTLNLIEMNDSRSTVANLASDITARSDARFGGNGRYLLEKNQKVQIPDVDAAAAQIAQTTYNLDFEAKQNVAAGNRRLLKDSDKVVIPDTDAAAAKIAQTAYNLGFEAQQDVSASAGSRQLLIDIRDDGTVDKSPIIRSGNVADVDMMTQNAASISNASNKVSQQMSDAMARVRSRFGSLDTPW